MIIIAVRKESQRLKKNMMSMKPFRIGRAIHSQCGRGCGEHGMINGAQLAELRDRIAITPQDLEKFSQKQAGDAADAWQGGDRIISALYAPFRTSPK